MSKRRVSLASGAPIRLERSAKRISIHEQLSSELGKFLRTERLFDKETLQGLLFLIGEMMNYKEEGIKLFPEVFVLKEVRSALRSLPNSEGISVGSGPKSSSTLHMALKTCAPLAQYGWSVYVCPRADRFEYGLLRCGLTALSLLASEQLIDEGARVLPAVLITHTSRNAIQVSGANKSKLQIYFGAMEQSTGDPSIITKRFCQAIVSSVPDHLHDSVLTLYSRVFAGVLRGGHGCLSAVLNVSKRSLPPQLRDGVSIRPPVDVASKVGDLLGRSVCESDTKLRATAALIRGMLMSDGVTVFRSDASVLAYHVFVKEPKAGGESVGGARRRAFEALCGWVGQDLDAAFFLSQDGHVEVRGGKG